ncbi:hypothetical protein K438DRAFT_1981351 [Mycena galopus ATCC 62051]|nr:hypothetical protein K438DRAFT_1981351 [Mycena galopus ATCC 62051]
MTAAPPHTANGVTYPQFIYKRNTVPVESTIGDASSAYSFPATCKSKSKGKPPHACAVSEFSMASGLVVVRELGQFTVPRPSLSPEAAPEWDAERGVDDAHEEEAYYVCDGPVSSPENELQKGLLRPHLAVHQVQVDGMAPIVYHDHGRYLFWRDLLWPLAIIERVGFFDWDEKEASVDV